MQNAGWRESAPSLPRWLPWVPGCPGCRWAERTMSTAPPSGCLKHGRRGPYRSDRLECKPACSHSPAALCIPELHFPPHLFYLLKIWVLKLQPNSPYLPWDPELWAF